MKYFHVISTGTSILTNFNQEAKNNKQYDAISKKYGMNDWSRLSPADPKQGEIEPHIARGSEVHEVLLSFIRSNPKRASAELNSFLSFLDEFRQPKDSIEIALYTTDTANNRLCAHLVYEYLNEKGFKSVGEPIRVRSISAREDFENGLIDLLDRVIRIIVNKSKQNYDIYVSATAGFKPETTFFVIASMLCSAKSPVVYYIHESFQKVVVLPLLPLELPSIYLNLAKEFKEPLHQNEVIEKLKKYDLSFQEMLDKRILIRTSDFMVMASEWLRKILEIRES